MKLHLLFIIGIGLTIMGCAEKEQGAPDTGDEAQQTTPAAEPTAAEALPASVETVRDAAFLDHMHAHAEHLDDLNYALADGDLEGALTPAYWLSTHDEVRGIPADWRPYVEGMREAAQAVEEAPDLAAARAAAERISAQCQNCHSAAGVSQ